MPYTDPWGVLAPQKSWELLNVEFSTGRGDADQPGWSVATGKWEGVDAVGIRWNGQDGETGPGSPQSRGHATWFIVPDELVPALMQKVARLKEERDGIECSVESPGHYSPGAWKVTISLTGEKLKTAGPQFFFFYPKVSNEMYHGDEGYIAIGDRGKGPEIGGQFRDGVWKGHLYTYNIQSKAESVSDVIREVIIATLKEQIAGVPPKVRQG